MFDLIGPGKHGIGTEGFYGSEGYRSMARRLVELKREGRDIDENDFYVRKVLDYYNCVSVGELKPYIK